MAKRKAAEVVEDEIDDEVDDTATDEVDDTKSSGSEMLSAKAAAALLGTDARTLRKFLRKQHGTMRSRISPNSMTNSNSTTNWRTKDHRC